ncbi:hypothetical protein PAHAL_1G198700 [Panicum hallii]|uniref:Large ribosomal subunit protein uL30 N-terminal eukaryotes domain-containing protein n=1 Tax=Panicum hallii TaxID=206008 RepID=A0A2S3GNE9_9POAL|nr:uncharacterized protein LOC112880015 [Panicum hallii]XP_025800258.1 uncharacterized protein LOC112880015 [Panicum hallii]XP_025800267.1 uncharacterized protein LOC112880015 [Panicum hallii]XP_025800275.1 uncharacterized protein LOC112880015 [Panicum hallii]PAN05354.1 hypothetical protein PAHAL_1G198700 [Panicum hallii]
MPPRRRSTRSRPWRSCGHLLPAIPARDALSSCSSEPLLCVRPLRATAVPRPPRSCVDSSPLSQVLEVLESVLRKGKREEQGAADRKENALADKKKVLESRKIILTRAKQYALEYDAQVC